MDKKIVVGLSGGVDSSISLVLLKNQGYRPIGVSLKLPVWKSKDNLLRENICCTTQSLNIAKKICKQLDVPYHIFDVRLDFKKKVVDYFISQLKKSKTPNPCIVCNQQLKFEKLFEFAEKVGAKYVATGHYTRTKLNPQTKKWQLLMAKDELKDQTYSLSFLPQKWLKYIIFPLGDFTKDEVYLMAKRKGFAFFLKKKQSQDFCFVAGKSLPKFLKDKVGEKQGLIVNTKGKVLGKHKGLHFYTIGQRKGISLSAGPWYVKELDVAKNKLIVTKDKKKISQKRLVLSPFHFISGEAPKEKIKVKAKVRYRQQLQPAILYPPEKKKLEIIFDKTVLAPTPGQFCVYYNKEGKVCLGGGAIVS